MPVEIVCHSRQVFRGKPYWFVGGHAHSPLPCHKHHISARLNLMKLLRIGNELIKKSLADHWTTWF